LKQQFRFYLQSLVSKWLYERVRVRFVNKEIDIVCKRGVSCGFGGALFFFIENPHEASVFCGNVGVVTNRINLRKIRETSNIGYIFKIMEIL